MARRMRRLARMTDQPRHERDDEQEASRPVVDESTYAGSASETGGLYHQDGPTRANSQGDTMSLREEDGDPPPENHSDG